MFSNLFYFLRLLFAASPALVIGELAWGVLTVLPGQLVSVLGVKYVIDIVTSGRDLKRLYAVVAVVVALLALCRLASYLYREFFWNVLMTSDVILFSIVALQIQIFNLLNEWVSWVSTCTLIVECLL